MEIKQDFSKFFFIDINFNDHYHFYFKIQLFSTKTLDLLPKF
jgi:hypothetical protein